MMESPVKERALQLAIGATVIAVNLAAFGNCYVFRHKCETFLNPACAAGGCMDLCEQGCLDAFLGESGVTIISPTVREATCTRYCGTSSGNWFQGSCTTPPRRFSNRTGTLQRCTGCVLLLSWWRWRDIVHLLPRVQDFALRQRVGHLHGGTVSGGAG